MKTLKELMVANQNSKDDPYVYLTYDSKDSISCTIKYEWSGWLRKAPSNFLKDAVIEIGSSYVDQADHGVNGHVIFLKKE